MSMSGGPEADGSFVYMGDRLVPAQDARVSVFDHAFLYGDGVFETYRVVEGRIFRMDDHLARLQRSAAAISLRLPLPLAEIKSAVIQTVEANNWPMSFVKSIITRGAGSEPLLEHTGLESRLVIIVRPSMPFFSSGASEVGLSAAIVGTRKTPAASLDPRIKSLNYLNVIKSRIDARGQGANESIMLDDRGRVVEASIYNIVVVSSRQLRTPSEGCLQGITLDATFEAAEQLGFAVERSHLYPYDLETADEVILTSTAVGLLPLVSLNGHPIGDGIPGPVFSELNDAYQQALRDPAQGVPTALARDLVSN